MAFTTGEFDNIDNESQGNRHEVKTNNQRREDTEATDESSQQPAVNLLEDGRGSCSISRSVIPQFETRRLALTTIPKNHTPRSLFCLFR